MKFTDSDALGYVVSQLAHIEARVFERKYASIVYQDLIPISFEAGEYATSIETHYTDGVTLGKFIGAAGDDLPYARVNSGRDQIPVAYAGIGFEYTMEELRQASFLNRPLDVMQANLARRGYEEHAQTVAFNGDSVRGLEGLLNHSAVSSSASASTLTAALAGGTPGDSAAALINEPINAVIDASKGVEIPDTVLMPIDHLNRLASTRLGTVNDTTILDYVRTKNASTARTGRPINIRSLPQLTSSMVVYSSNPDVMVMHIPLPLRFLPPQFLGLKVRVPGEYKLSGLEMRYPGAITYRTGF